MAVNRGGEWMLFAQEPVTEILKLAVNGGSFALLAILVIYILPKMRRETAEERKAERDSERNNSTESLTQVTSRFDKALETVEGQVKYEREQCDKQTEKVMQGMNKIVETMLANQQALERQGQALQAALSEHRRRT